MLVLLFSFKRLLSQLLPVVVVEVDLPVAVPATDREAEDEPDDLDEPETDAEEDLEELELVLDVVVVTLVGFKRSLSQLPPPLVLVVVSVSSSHSNSSPSSEEDEAEEMEDGIEDDKTLEIVVDKIPEEPVPDMAPTMPANIPPPAVELKLEAEVEATELWLDPGAEVELTASTSKLIFGVETVAAPVFCGVEPDAPAVDAGEAAVAAEVVVAAAGVVVSAAGVVVVPPTPNPKAARTSVNALF